MGLQPWLCWLMLVINAFFFPVHKTVSAFARTLGAEICFALVADSLYDSISILYQKRTDRRHCTLGINFVFANNFNGHKLRRTFTPLNYFLIIPILNHEYIFGSFIWRAINNDLCGVKLNSHISTWRDIWESKCNEHSDSGCHKLVTDTK